MFKKILIANRGEIAIRIIRACREMGIGSVAVYSDPDSSSLHALEADESRCLGSAEHRQSYLNMDKIIGAARETGAEAIHPGYGFLAENPDFAERCLKEKITYIGPPPEAIRKLGDKVTARQTMEKEGVPVIPGISIHDAGYDEMKRTADKIGYPVVIKAAAGGGGKGMRIVRSPEDLRDASDSASSEAMAAFGNGRVFLEKFIESPRHIEFQVLADTDGNIIHLLERECSIQRRFQKIIEETPSPAMTPELREEMGRAAIRAARAAGYVNAGTVEFILGRDGKFYFLEVNTRLQVEHPITEMITGIDIVRKQIEIAAGGKLNMSQKDISVRGHAMECRIYAEDPEQMFAPSPGTISFLSEPKGPGIRVDSGVYQGFAVPMEYDPLLCKLITHGETRDVNIKRMINALKNYIVLGIKTPIPFMIDILGSGPFLKGDTCTDFIDKYFKDWKPGMKDARLAVLGYLASMLSPAKKNNYQAVEGDRSSPWKRLGNWRL